LGAKILPTGVELYFDRNEIIVSKTDLKGHLTYANQVFLRLAGYTEEEVLGAQHNIVRHPDMPRCVFKLLWDTIQAGDEIFAYVVNMAKNGDHYWVFAHVTPTFNSDGVVTSYHSNRRVPDTKILNEVIKPLYKQLIDIENSCSNKIDGMEKSFQAVLDILEEKEMSYDEFIFSL